jgi:hypothetical protein
MDGMSGAVTGVVIGAVTGCNAGGPAPVISAVFRHAAVQAAADVLAPIGLSIHMKALGAHFASHSDATSPIPTYMAV